MKSAPPLTLAAQTRAKRPSLNRPRNETVPLLLKSLARKTSITNYSSTNMHFQMQPARDGDFNISSRKDLGQYRRSLNVSNCPHSVDPLGSEKVIPSFSVSFSVETDAIFPKALKIQRSPHGQASLYHDIYVQEQSSKPREDTTLPVSDAAKSKATAPDFSIFFTEKQDIFRPISINLNRTEQQKAALESMLALSVKYLFGSTEAEAAAAMMPNMEQLSPVDAIGKQQGTLAFLSTTDHGDASSKKRKRENSSPLRNNSKSSTRMIRFRSYQTESWDATYDDLVEYRKVNHHCCVPYDYPPNPSLARWVKRQRYQYKLFQKDQASAMTLQRVKALENIGFIWDAHTAAWGRGLVELKAYLRENGDCNVPATYKASTRLASWVKCQRKQFRLYAAGKQSTMTHYRINALHQLGFQWQARNPDP